MKKCLKAYSKIFFLDATYKLLELRLPVYLFMVEDSMGETEVVAVGILVAETEDNVRWMLESLRERNPEFKPRVFMADKDFNERAIIKELFPTATVLICLFHSLRSFKREISDKALGLPEGTQVVLKELFQSMCYAKSEDEYTKHYEHFMNAAPLHVQKYFDKNSHNIRQEWVLSFVFSCGNFLNTTNNRVESFNGKLKSVIESYSSLEDFLHGLFTTLYATRNERNHKAATNYQKRKVLKYLPGSIQEQYTTLLTSYAAGFVTQQIEYLDRVGNMTENRNGVFHVHSSRGVEKVSNNSCTCLFFSCMRLPCRHIFAVRQTTSENMYDESLCDIRWTNDFFKNNQRIFSKSFTVDNEPVVVQVIRKKHKILNKAQKFRESSTTTTKLAQLASDVGPAEYLRRMEVLKTLALHWENGHEVSIHELSRGKVVAMSFFISNIIPRARRKP